MNASMSRRTPEGQPAEAAEVIERTAALLFAPLDKRAFGTAIGFVAAIGVFALTVAALARRTDSRPELELLAQYFSGYTVSWTGALIGSAWAFAVGFVAGWFVAFVRNLVLAVSLFIIRRRVELDESRDFLDHI